MESVSRRCAHAAVVVDGSVLILGGYNGTTHMREAWRSDDRGATWTQLPQPPWGATNGVGGVVVDGSVLVLGGYHGVVIEARTQSVARFFVTKLGSYFVTNSIALKQKLSYKSERKRASPRC